MTQSGHGQSGKFTPRTTVQFSAVDRLQIIVARPASLLRTESGHGRLRDLLSLLTTPRTSQAPVERYPVSRHHQSRNSRRARVPSAGWSGRDLRSAIFRHRSLSFFMFSSAAFRSAICCSARSARRRSSASASFDGAEDDAAAVASGGMALSVVCGNGALARLIDR
jgi:hypothetical protein